ncbi:hypothetical protein CPB85DRAFT_1253978 [Mucidula mucida]|nr:hypothetical protein CPB85DRAFT_1253978 [Mucidula mucida]
MNMAVKGATGPHSFYWRRSQGSANPMLPDTSYRIWIPRKTNSIGTHSVASARCRPPAMGKVHEYLISLGVDYLVILRGSLSFFLTTMVVLQVVYLLHSNLTLCRLVLWVAKTLRKLLGIKITHTRVGADELKWLYLGFGLSEERATLLVTLENLNVSGVEKIFANPNKVSGKMTLPSFVEAKRMLGKRSGTHG